MFVVPFGSCTRAQARYGTLARHTRPPATSRRRRSLLLFGIEPQTTVGFGVSSFVPWPNELSFWPVARSTSQPTLVTTQVNTVLGRLDQSLPPFGNRFPSIS